MQGDGVTLSLEEQLCALSLAEPADSDQKDMVSLNGSRFRSEVFQESRESTKVTDHTCTMCVKPLQYMLMYNNTCYVLMMLFYFRYQPF